MNEIIEKIPLDQIVPDPRNRKHGGRSPEELAGLAASIRAHGVQEPAIVRKVEGAEAPYMLVAGERRFLASKLAGEIRKQAVVLTSQLEIWRARVIPQIKAWEARI